MLGVIFIILFIIVALIVNKVIVSIRRFFMGLSGSDAMFFNMKQHYGMVLFLTSMIMGFLGELFGIL